MSKASVKITGVRDIAAATQKAINLINTDKDLFNDLGQTVVNRIVGSAKTGKDIENKNFKDVSDSWRTRRQRLATVNQTDELFRGRSKKSNLTFSGQLLNSFKYKLNMTALTIGFYFAGIRTPYKGIKKPVLAGLKTNEELAKQIEKTRPFVFVSQKLNELLTLKVIQALRRNLRNYKRLSKVLNLK